MKDQFDKKKKYGYQDNKARRDGGYTPGAQRGKYATVKDKPETGKDRPGYIKNKPETGKDRPGYFKDKPESARVRPEEVNEKPVSIRETAVEEKNGREPVEGAVIGRNAVRELLKAEREIDKIFVRKGDREGSIVVIIAEAKNAGIPVIEVEKAKLDSMSGGANHQGVVAMAAEKEYSSVEDILKIAEERGEPPLIVIADGITDPYNLGTLIRCAEGVGAHGLIIPKRRASGLTPLVTKASAGAIEHLAIAKVPNITAAIETLKEKGVWIFAAESGGKAYYETDFKGPCAIVLGSEGEGISRLVLEKSDFIVSIPMYGKVNSFNVSTAAAVILAEVSRQHRGGINKN
jgi:23S rRNA (guanosine2251-2'-O)-methyltransferase